MLIAPFSPCLTTDPGITAQLPAVGTTSGTFSYDTSATGVGLSPTVYTYTPSGLNSLSIVFDNGLEWSTDPSGEFTISVFDRTPGSGADVIRFNSTSSLISIAGLTPDQNNVFVQFVDGSGTALTDGTLPLEVNLADWGIPNNIDLRAEDSTGSEFRIYGAITNLRLVGEVKSVALDVKPGSCPNPINIKSRGVIPVAILGTESFDVATIDPTTIRLHGVAARRSNLDDVATPFVGELIDERSCSTEGADGFLDLTLKFKTQEVVAAIGEVEDGGVLREVEDGDVLILTLTGSLLEEFGGTEIKGEDIVVILALP